MDVVFATASLLRFTDFPRKGRLDRVLRVFGYLKKYKNRRILIDSKDLIHVDGKYVLEFYFRTIFKDQYPESV